MIRLPILLAVFLSLTLPANAQALWGNTRAGMSVADVKRIFPNAVPPAAPSSTAAETQVLLTIPRLILHQEPYRTAFIFRDHKLEKVTLSHSEGRSFDRLLSAYAAALASLRTELGQETSHRTERSAIIKNEEHTWFSGDRAVQISLVAFLDATAVLAIRYQAKTEKGVYRF